MCKTPGLGGDNLAALALLRMANLEAKMQLQNVRLPCDSMVYSREISFALILSIIGRSMDRESDNKDASQY